MKKTLMPKTLLIFLTLGLALLLVNMGMISEVNAAGTVYRVVPGGITSGNCGDTWANGCDLQYALVTKSESGDELWVKTGTYKPTTTTDRAVSFMLKSGVEIYGGFNGTEMSRDERNWATNVTTLSGDIGTTGDNSDNSYHVVTGSGTNNTAVLDGFTITGGNANGAESIARGGGMYDDQGSPALENVIFSGNSATLGGGMCNSTNSSPMLANVTFSNNTATQRGGGMFNFESSPTLTNITFSGNSASYGGGMYNYQNSSPTLTGIIFSNNNANLQGGGIFNGQLSNPALTNVTFSGNSAIYGGGMYNYSQGNPVVKNAILWGNSADYGAEIYNQSSYPTISNSDIKGCMPGGVWNTACGTDGGGNLDADPLFMDVTNGNLHLQTASPAIDTGDNAAVPAGITTDLDGNPRVMHGTVDMGVYEFQQSNYVFRVVPAGATSGNCGYDWAHGCDLQYALGTKSYAGDELWVETGTYKPTTSTDRTVSFVLKSGVALYGGFAGTETSREQRNWATNVTTLSGDIGTTGNNSDNSYHVVTGSGTNSAAVLDGFTITGGNANGSDPNDIGGGMLNDAGSPTLTNLTFSGNSATKYGGGMSNLDSSPSLTNVTFSGNTAYDSGGGMANANSNALLTNVTFSGNMATSRGGGMYNENSSPQVKNAILWGDSAPAGAEIYNNASTPTISSSDIQGCMPGGVWDTDCGTDGGGNLDADPRLGVLGAYGGGTQTLPLLPGSAAIDTGNDTSCPATDQRGVGRPQVAGCDMGAYESRGFTLTKISGDEQVTLVNTAFAEPLVVGVSSAYDEPVDGGVVTFTAPVSGPSAIPQTSTVMISEGFASQSLTANGDGGSYSITIDTSGAVDPAVFTLRNILSYISYAAPEAKGSGDCSSWANVCKLQTALASSFDGNEIWVQEGVHYPGTERTDTFMLKSGVEIYGGFNGTETSLEQRNWATNITTLSGDIGTTGDNSDNSYHVVTGSGTNNTAVLDGFTITGGNANGDPNSTNVNGGGMYNDQGSPTLMNLNFNNNYGWARGGGMYNIGSSDPTLTNVTFRSNWTSSNGGGMYNFQSNPVLMNVAFYDNTATHSGGGMFNSESSPTLTNITFSGNSASSMGGGMFNSDSSLVLKNVTFCNNTANGGGGMHNYHSSLTLTNVTFSGNSATYGGGMSNDLCIPLSLTNVTFSGNTATSGGGMYNYKIDNIHGAIKNVIMWGDSASTGNEIYNDGGRPNISTSNVQGCGGSEDWTEACGVDGGGNIDADPLLGVLGDYGGFTQTLPLLPGSAAIDTGGVSICPEEDQRGITRPQGAGCDMGAYESRGFTLTKVSGDEQITLVNTVFAEPLVVGVGSTVGEPVDGGVVTFTAPASGPSTDPPINEATISAGKASQSLTANGEGGFYNVTTNTAGAATTVEFALHNHYKYLHAAPVARGSEDCSSWENACTLQMALAGSINGNEIWVQEGVHYPGAERTDTFMLKSGVEIYGGFNGTETSREQRNWATNITTLSGDIGMTGDNSDNSYHVVTGSGTNNTAVLDGFTITGGNANGAESNGMGGGMYDDQGSPALENVIFSGNSATYGGGMCNSTNSSPMLANVTFSSNTANYCGGGNYNIWSNPTLTDVAFHNNMSTYDGGGMNNYQSSPTLTNVIFSGNAASSGGGIYNTYSNPTMMNVTISGNTAGYDGGGVYNNRSSPSMTNITFNGNIATSGGGMYNYYESSTPVIKNAILWGNRATNGTEIYNNASTPTISSSDVQGCGGSGEGWVSACGTDGGGNIDADPLLGALGAYGGATQTLPLLPGSAAIDTGNDTSCPATDQRDVARPQCGGCDMGAYESRGFSLTKISGDEQITLVNAAFANPLVESVGSTGGEPVDGGVVTFTAPVSGPSAIPQTSRVTISEGLASQSLTANGDGGEYSVMVDTAGAVEPSIFMLKNLFGIYLPAILR